MKNICVIIPMYNHNEMTSKCVEMTRQMAGMQVDILVVDDGSKEPYVNDKVHVLRLDKNSGYTNATNQGILWCADRYKYLHLQNNDIEPEQDYIKILYDYMEESPAVGIASSIRKLKRDDEFIYELYGVDLIRGYQQLVNQDFLDEYKDPAMFVNWLPICSSLVRLETLRYIGILDRNMIMWCSDNDICIRANFAGWNVAIVMKSFVAHKHNVSTGTNNEEGVKRDQMELLNKIANYKYAKLMTDMPLDQESNVYGKNEFQTYKKEKVESS